jgi:hypothetical protein
MEYEQDVQPMMSAKGKRYYPVYRKVGGRGWNYYMDGEGYLWFDSHQKAWKFTESMDGPYPALGRTVAQQDTTHTIW